MKVTVQCPAGHQFQTEEIHLGKTVRCPHPGCGMEFILLAEEAATRATEPAAPPTSPDETVTLGYGRPGQGTSMVPFSVGASIEQGWEVLKSRYWVLVGAWVVATLISFGMGLIPILGALVNLMVSPVLIAGLFFMGVTAYRGYALGMGNLFDGFKRFWAILGIQSLIYLLMIPCLIPTGLGVVAGFVLDSSFGSSRAWVPIIVGCIASAVAIMMVMIRLIFATQVCLETGLGVMDSLRRSWTITSLISLPLIGLMVLLGIGSFVSMALLFLPYVFFWAPFSIGVFGAAYGLAADQSPVASVVMEEA